MKEQSNSQCQFCSQGKCYVNASTSPEEYDMHIPTCTSCDSPVLKKDA